MKTALSRRHALGLVAAAATLRVTAPARAASAAEARAFVNSFGQQLIAIVNSARSLSDKKVAILPLLQDHVDMDAMGRYCLGRYWRVATPEQQTRFLALFHQILVNKITTQIGDYRGVTFTIGNVSSSGAEQAVDTVISRPEQPAFNAQWIVSFNSGKPMVVDVKAEGPSLRMTTRDDYTAFITRHNDSIDALLHALDHQLQAHGTP